MNYKSLGVATLALLCSLSNLALAQSSSMSLEECLEYAKLNSITLQKARVEIDNNAADQLSAKGAFLPTVTGNVGQNVNSNPLNTDPSAYKSSYSGSYSADLSMTLYSGGSNRSSLQQSKLGGSIAELLLNESSNAIEVAVTDAYVRILYAMEQIKVAEKSLDVSRQSEARGLAFLEAGSINEVDYAQLQSATAGYEYDLISAKTTLSNLYVTLKHLLEITQNAPFDVKAPNFADAELLTAIPSVEEVYAAATESRPEILSSKLYVESAELSARIAKASYLPKLTLSAGTGLTHNTSSAFNLGNQLRNNYNSSAGLNLSIPIFNGFQTRAAVTQAENSIKTASLTLNEQEKNLYQTIETLHNNVETSQSKYLVSKSQLTANTKSLSLTTQQYELGMKNTIELLTEQDNCNQAMQELLTNKYLLILNKALLNFYQTNIIKL